MEDGPLPLYCSEECRRIDQEGAVFDVDRSATDNSPRSIHDLKVDLPWSRPGLLPNVQAPLLSRNSSLPAFPFATTTTHRFAPLPPAPKPSEKELWQKRVHEEFVNGQKYKVEPWLNPEFRATIQRTPAPRALEIIDVLHAPGRTSRPSSYVGTVTYGPDEEVKTSLGGEDGFRNWYYGDDARSLPATYGMRRELPASVVEKKPAAGLSFARQPSATNISRPPSIKSRSNSNTHNRTRSQQTVLSSLYPSAAAIPNVTNNNDDNTDHDGEPWWVTDERRDYAEYMDALQAEDRGGPAVGTLDDWLKMREARRRARFESEEKAERRRSMTNAISAGNSTTSLAGTKTPLLMRRLSSSRTAIHHQHQHQVHPQVLTPSKPSTRQPSPPSGITIPDTTAPTERHISLNDPSPPYRITVVPRRHSLLASYTNKDAGVYVQPQRPRGFSRGISGGAASPRSPLGLHTISRQSLEDVTIIPPPIDFSALTLDTALALVPVPAPAPEPAPAPAPTPAPASIPALVPAHENPSAATPAPTAPTSLPDKKPPRSPTSPKTPPRRARLVRPRGLSAISYLRPLEPIVLPTMAKAVPTRTDGTVAALSPEDHDADADVDVGAGGDHEHAHASGSGSDSSGTLVSYGSGSTRVGGNSHDGLPFKHSALDVGKMSKVDEVREDGELSKSPAEQSLSRAFAAGNHHDHHSQRSSRSSTSLFTRPMSLVWSSGQDVQRPHMQGQAEENSSRRHSLWVLFGSVRS